MVLMLVSYLILVRLSDLVAGQKDDSEFQRWRDEMKQVCVCVCVCVCACVCVQWLKHWAIGSVVVS